MDANVIVEMVLGGIVALMLYFLKVLHSDVRQNTKDVGQNKGHLKNLETQIHHEREMRNQNFDQIMTRLDEIIKDLKEMHKR